MEPGTRRAGAAEHRAIFVRRIAYDPLRNKGDHAKRPVPRVLTFLTQHAAGSDNIRIDWHIEKPDVRRLQKSRWPERLGHRQSGVGHAGERSSIRNVSANHLGQRFGYDGDLAIVSTGPTTSERTKCSACAGRVDQWDLILCRG